MLAVGGDCLADIAVLRAQPAVFGSVASDPTVSRLIDTLARDADRSLAAIDRARAAARSQVWAAAGEQAPDHGTDRHRPLVIDIDATLITAHSDKEHAAPTFKRGFGFHPLLSFADHGQDGASEPLSCLLRKGNAGPTPLPITSRCCGRRSPNCPVTGQESGRKASAGAG